MLLPRRLCAGGCPCCSCSLSPPSSCGGARHSRRPPWRRRQAPCARSRRQSSAGPSSPLPVPHLRRRRHPSRRLHISQIAAELQHGLATASAKGAAGPSFPRPAPRRIVIAVRAAPANLPNCCKNWKSHLADGLSTDRPLEHKQSNDVPPGCCQAAPDCCKQQTTKPKDTAMFGRALRRHLEVVKLYR